MTPKNNPNEQAMKEMEEAWDNFCQELYRNAKDDKRLENEDRLPPVPDEWEDYGEDY